MVCGTIFTYQTGTVEAKNYGQFLNGYIMHYLIVGPLHEGGINITEHTHALRSQTGTEGNSMLLTDTHIKSTVWPFNQHEI
jgi:hypothetical protein